MSENEFRVNQEAGDESGGAAPADGRVHRAALLTDALAEDCTTKMFTLRANGPHALGIAARLRVRRCAPGCVWATHQPATEPAGTSELPR